MRMKPVKTTTPHTSIFDDTVVAEHVPDQIIAVAIETVTRATLNTIEIVLET